MTRLRFDGPSPLAGEGESAELTVDGQAEGVRGTAEHGQGNLTGDDHPFTTRMTVSEAIRLVGRLERSLARDAELRPPTRHSSFKPG